MISREHSEVLKAVKRKDAKQSQGLMCIHLDGIKETSLNDIETKTRVARRR